MHISDYIIRFCCVAVLTCTCRHFHCFSSVEVLQICYFYLHALGCKESICTLVVRNTAACQKFYLCEHYLPQRFNSQRKTVLRALWTAANTRVCERFIWHGLQLKLVVENITLRCSQAIGYKYSIPCIKPVLSHKLQHQHFILLKSKTGCCLVISSEWKKFLQLTCKSMSQNI